MSPGVSAELAQAAEALVGTELDGRYRIDALLGAGGMGAVFRGYHRFMDIPVAIKVLRPHLARDPNAVERFVREARGTFKVASDHAVKVLDFSVTEGGLLYMVLELLEGRTVGDELAADGPIAPRRALRIARQACDALAAAHRVGLIHRDLKPDNLMLTRRNADPDFLKVLDFGLAKVMEGTGEQALSLAALTQGGIVFGTPDYMAPEQALGETLDGRCDVYALGATLFEMLTGRPPFPRSSPLEVLAAHVRDVPPRLAEVRPGLKLPAVDAVLAACLAKRPQQRPATAEALAELIASAERSLAGVRDVGAETQPVAALVPPPPQPAPSLAIEIPRSRRVWVVGAVALGAAALVVTLALSNRPRPGGHAMVASAPVDAGSSPDAPGPVDAGVVDAAVPLDAAGAGAGRHPAPVRIDPEKDKVDAHLAAAGAARRDGNRLRQLTEADAALSLAPRNRTALFLVGDALVGAGDLARGCGFLARARSRAAKARAAAAGCP